MKVLAHKDKHSDNFWDASTKEKEAAAFLRMFELLDNEGGKYSYYADLDEGTSELVQEVQELQSIKASFERGTLAKIAERALGSELEQLPRKERELASCQSQLALYKLAKKGDAKAARRFVELRKDYEYEGWDFIEVENPLSDRVKV